MKAIAVGLIGVLLVAVFIYGLLIGGFSSGPVWTSEFPDYSMVVDGDHLYVVNISAPPKFDVVKGPSQPVTIEGQTQAVGNVIAVTYQGKTHWHKFVDGWNSGFWSQKRQAVFFEATVSSGRPANTFPKGEIWKWTPKGGFVRIAQTATPLRTLSESIDGDSLSGQTTGYDAKYENRVFTYSFQTKTVKYLKSNADWNVRDMITPTKFLDDHGNVLNTKTGKVEKIPLNNYFGQAVVFHRAVWMIRRNGGDYEAVRLSKDLSKVETTFPFPKGFPSSHREAFRE